MTNAAIAFMIHAATLRPAIAESGDDWDDGDKKALRYTCRGQQHSHSNEQCKLYPQKAREKRWPGCNLKHDKAVTEEYYNFCERMRWRKRQKTNPQ